MTHEKPKSRVAPAFWLAILVCLLAGPAAAEGDAPSSAAADSPPELPAYLHAQLARIPSGDDGVKEVIDELASRLELSAEQREQIESPVSDWVAKAGRIRDKVVSGAITPMAFSMQFEMASRVVAHKVEQKLTPEQVIEYRALLEEQRQQIAEAAQGGQSASPPPTQSSDGQ